MEVEIQARGRIDRPRTSIEDTVVETSIDSGPWKRLRPDASLRVRRHSPTGFAWGYGGSGPAQLALALLLDGTNRHFAETYYQRLKTDVVAKIEWTGDGEGPSDPWYVRIDVGPWLIESFGRDAIARSGRGFDSVEIVQPYRGDWATPLVAVESSSIERG